jgi:hypothetical protein
MKEVAEIEAIKTTNRFKYLGLQISCDRKEIIKDAKKKVRQYLGYMKGED